MLPTIFKDEVQLLPLLHHRNKSNDSIMSDHLQMPDLPLDTGESIPVKTFHFFVCFDGIAGMILLANCKGDHREGSFANVGHNFVLLESVIAGAELIEIAHFLGMYCAIRTLGRTGSCPFLLPGSQNICSGRYFSLWFASSDEILNLSRRVFSFLFLY